jgi:F-type H+-transporting ATPase subunit b
MELFLPQIITHSIGFILVVLLLKKFAWGPLTDMLEERREKIVSEFREIEYQKKDVENQKAQYDDKLKEIEGERREKLLEGVNEGQKIANELKATAQNEAKELITRAKAESEREVTKAKAQLKKDMVDITLVAAEKMLNEKLTEEKDRQLVGGFIDKIQQA